ncbi:cytochrome P450 [Halohasta salina]|uniref:cytochrome P450 n=1 Tax=Halohasta salina TaxID=2961621 RepID=UPI0020A39BAC|nr:cytochrome P450 [Halohasta salina]
MRPQPPGPKGVPVFGNSNRFADDPFAFMDACADAYGDVIGIDLGPQPLYMLTNPRDIERVLVAEASSFPKRDLGDDAVDRLLGEGLLTSEGAAWQDKRQRANPAFHSGRINSLADMMVDHTEAMVADWNDGDRVDVHVEVARLTVRIIVSAMFGTDIDPERVEAIQTHLEPLGRRFEPDPFGRLVPDWAPTKKNREFRAAVDALEAIIDDIVAERRGTEGGDGDEPMDLLSILLRAQRHGEVTDGDIRDEMMTMLLAGHDTTALTLTYTWYLLSQHPEVEERLHAELDAVLGGDRPTAADSRRLSYTTNVLNEAMRLYPPVYTLFREAAVDAEFGGYQLPAGSGLMLPQWVVHRSPRWYDDPETFDPDRWESARSSERPRFAFFPFGGGPRHCIGKQFSMLEATVILSIVAQEYTMEYLGSDDLSLRGSLTMHPEEPVAMRLRER